MRRISSSSRALILSPPRWARAELLVEPAAQRPRHGIGLLDDLLVQVVRVLAAIVGILPPDNLRRRFGGRHVVECQRAKTARFEHRKLAVIQVHDLPGVSHQRGNV